MNTYTVAISIIAVALGALWVLTWWALDAQTETLEERLGTCQRSREATIKVTQGAVEAKESECDIRLESQRAGLQSQNDLCSSRLRRCLDQPAKVEHLTDHPSELLEAWRELLGHSSSHLSPSLPSPPSP